MKYFFENNNAVVENGILKYIKPDTIIVIPESTTRILGDKEECDFKNDKYGNSPFYESLIENDIVKMAVLPEKQVKVIGAKAFEHCHQLENINIPEGVEEIHLSAFLGCYRLTSIELPKSIKVLDEWCFGLIKGLIINYKGTMKEWEKIKKDPHFAEKKTLINTKDGELLV